MYQKMADQNMGGMKDHWLYTKQLKEEEKKTKLNSSSKTNGLQDQSVHCKHRLLHGVRD